MSGNQNLTDRCRRYDEIYSVGNINYGILENSLLLPYTTNGQVVDRLVILVYVLHLLVTAVGWLFSRTITSNKIITSLIGTIIRTGNISVILNVEVMELNMQRKRCNSRRQVSRYKKLISNTVL